VLNWTEDSGWVIVNLSGELDMGNSSSFKNEVVNELISKGKVDIALDFTNLDYIDSSGLGVIVSLHKRSKINGGRLAICNLNETLTRLFKLTSLDRALNIYPDFKSVLQNG